MKRARPISLAIEPALPEERVKALRMLFQYLGAEDRETRVANALEMLRRGELDSAGVVVARDEHGLLGALVCQPVPGAGGLFWPPQTVNQDDPEIEDQLLHYGIGWVRRKGAKLAQALLTGKEIHLAPSLERNGFNHITRLLYMRHHLDLNAGLLGEPEGLVYQAFNRGNLQLFQEILLKTYEETCDCPEVTGVRNIDEVIAGHQSQGLHDPECWWLALADDGPVGVLLLTEVPDWKGWDILYLGVIPEARGRGIGRELARKALVEARANEASQLTLSVDARNHPALNLYRGLGFQTFDQREVYLALWH